MDRLAGDGRGVGDGIQRVDIIGAQTNLGEGVRQTAASGELDEVADLTAGSSLQHELGDRADVDLLAVRQLMGRGHRGQAIVNGVGRGQAAGLDDLFAGGRALVDKVNAALKQYVADGSWKASLEINAGPSGYSMPDPPTPGNL